MTVGWWLLTAFLADIFCQYSIAFCCYEEPPESPYVVDNIWRQLLDAQPPLEDERRGAMLLELLQQRLGVKAPPWWQPLVKSVAVGPRSAHMIENDESLKGLSKRWNTEGNAPFAGFTAVTGAVNEKHLELSEGHRNLQLTDQID